MPLGSPVLSDFGACWCDERGRAGETGRVRAMRVVVAQEDNPGAIHQAAVPQPVHRHIMAARLEIWGRIGRR